MEKIIIDVRNKVQSYKKDGYVDMPLTTFIDILVDAGMPLADAVLWSVAEEECYMPEGYTVLT